jgi:phospholipid/cholesterol/gamma-HCH transport system substrate-binding protein
MPGVLTRTETLMFSTDRLVNNMGNSWLFGGGATSTDLLLKAGDSHD